MTISTESYTTAAGQARKATERSVEVWKNGVKTIADQLDAVQFPSVDLIEAVAGYFEYLQKAVDVNRELATRWAELFTDLSGSAREQVLQANHIVSKQTDLVADLTVERAEQAEQAAMEQAEHIARIRREQAREAEEAEKVRVREAQRVEREEAGKAQQQIEEAAEAEGARVLEAQRVEREEARNAQRQARQVYEGLTKGELSDELAERGLPKTGNIEELIERLVSADSE